MNSASFSPVPAVNRTRVKPHQAALEMLVRKNHLTRQKSDDIARSVERNGAVALCEALNQATVPSNVIAEVLAICTSQPLYPSDEIPREGVLARVPDLPPTVVASGSNWVFCRNGIIYLVNPFDQNAAQEAFADCRSHTGTKMAGMGLISRRDYYELAEKGTASAKVEPLFNRSERSASNKAESGLEAFREEEGGINFGKWLENLINTAAREDASDIHIVPTETALVIRLRINGDLRDHADTDMSNLEGIANILLTRAGKQAGQYNLPCGGGFPQTIYDAKGNPLRSIKLRMSMIPATLPNRIEESPKFTLRLLGNEREFRSLEDLGIPDYQGNRMLTKIKLLTGKRHGLVYVTGPTGSGKTTTLAASQQEGKKLHSDRAHYSVEDPVEITQKGIVQVQVNEKTVTFDDALKNLLQQDPDAINIGECRTGDVAKIACRAAMTGHLVFSTLHTNNAVRTIPRLIDMGVDRYVLAQVLKAVMAQRLVKVACPKCSEQISWEQLLKGRHSSLDREDGQLFRIKLQQAEEVYSDLDHYPGTVPGGGTVMVSRHPTDEVRAYCTHCKGTGHIGRRLVCELLEITPVIEDMISTGASSVAIYEQAIEEGFKEMWQHAMYLVTQKKITFADAVDTLGDRERMQRRKAIE